MLLDPQEHELAQRLADAGERAREAGSGRPGRAFAADLRDRLLSEVPQAEDDHETRVGVGWSLPSLFRMPRLVPLAIASVLLLAGVVAARELYVAIGDRPTPTPAPSVEVVPSDSADPSLAPSLVPIFEPTASVVAEPTSVATAKPTPRPTPKPTPRPTPKPTPTPAPALGVLTLSALSCDGGVVLFWSPYEGAGAFNHYTTLRNTTASIPKAYPPQGGAVDPGGTYTTNPGATSAVDAELSAGVTYYYRTMAFNADDGVIAASAIADVVARPMASLGALGVGPVAEGTQLTWNPYDAGSADCFTYYKLVYSETNPSPSYLGGDPYLAAISSQATGSYVAPAGDLLAGHTYYLRVQVIRGTELGAFVVAQSGVSTYSVP
jgi:hypothetical protein